MLSLNTLSLVCGHADNSCKGVEEKQDSFTDSFWQLTSPLHPPLSNTHTHTHSAVRSQHMRLATEYRGWGVAVAATLAITEVKEEAAVWGFFYWSYQTVNRGM